MVILSDEEEKRLWRERWNRSEVLVEEARQYFDADSLEQVDSYLYHAGDTVDALYELVREIAFEGGGGVYRLNGVSGSICPVGRKES
jgi:DNA-binding ferritin-like protein (Dps family)